MKILFLVSVAFGCALGAQPGIWANDTCPNRGDLASYIVLGEDAPEGQFPYMISLNFVLNKGHACGASVLTKNWALTAAHCCDTKYDMYIYAGSNSLSKGGKDYRIEFMKKHEQYAPSQSWRNDICLIKMKDPLDLGKNIQKVTLPPQNWPVNDGDLVTITGWGYTEPDKEVVPDKLQIGRNFVVLSPQKCFAQTGQKHESYLCAVGGKKGQGVCNGDSGSPLMKNGVQVGLASFVYLPCGCGKPEFYNRVPIFIDWIKKNLGSEASELKFAK